MKNKFLLLLIIVISSFNTHAQNLGSISGKVIDQNTGEILIGASLQLVGTTNGATTDIEGRFTIRKVNPGTYKLKASFVSYDSSILDSVQVNANEVTIIDISLAAKSLQLEQVVITSESVKNFEAALLNQQKKSISINDGLSAEQMKRSTDANMADAMRRIPGVTLSEGKFINLRGLSERYSSAMFNNAALASTEPEKRSFAFDLIPSSLIDNTIVTKSYSAENPADFGSGLISLNTIDFPSKRLFSISFGSSFVDGVTSRNILTYNGGKKDFIGIDDGTRALPADFPTDLENDDQTQIFIDAKKLSNNWKTISAKAPVNQSYGIAFGDKFMLLDQELGLILSFNYKKNTNSAEVTRKELMKEINADGRYAERFSFSGTQYSESVLWGGLANLSYKFDDFHKLSLKNSYTVNADDEVVNMIGQQNDQSSYRQNIGLRYISRTLLANQLTGDLYFPEINGAQLQYQLSFSESNRSEPDYRRYAYELDTETNQPLYMILGPEVSPQLAGRYYSDLYEKSKSSSINIKVPVGIVKLKFGFSYTEKKRNFDSRLIGIVSQSQTKESIKKYAIDSIFAEKNFRSTFGFSLEEYNNGTNVYTASELVRAGYIVTETPVSVYGNEFVVSLGMRMESLNSLLSSFLQDHKDIAFNIARDEIKFFPSATIAYRINEKSNFKTSYSRTINRPEFRETAPFTYYDFQNQISTKGDTTVGPASISHVDLRYEIFPRPEELFSVSIFYKEIKNAIEATIIAGSNAMRSFKNAPLAKNVGFEVEGRFKLDHISNMLSDVSVVANYSRIKSEIHESRVDDNGLKKPFLRSLQGQAPYIVNLSLIYHNTEFGSNIALSFYQSGRRIIETADPEDQRSISDIYEEPRPLLDFVASQMFMDLFELKLSIKDILVEDQKLTMLDYTLRRTSKHAQYSLGINFKL
ncbi:MAG: TonB-dependent receptor [Ignavibacteriales bacterium]|nr:TonB-dependent receptor [Ignavibacteriales bacterium]